MKPQSVRVENLDVNEVTMVLRWMEANGLRHYVPYGATIRITGNRFTVETMDIERTPTARTITSVTHGRHWADRWRHGRAYLPLKTRTYRIRHELKDIR